MFSGASMAKAQNRRVICLRCFFLCVLMSQPDAMPNARALLARDAHAVARRQVMSRDAGYAAPGPHEKARCRKRDGSQCYSGAVKTPCPPIFCRATSRRPIPPFATFAADNVLSVC